MYYPVEIVVKNYKPLTFEPGMLFITRIHYGTPKEYTEIWEFKKSHLSQEEFIKQHGYPVELYIVDSAGERIADPEQIGWFDEGDHVDEYRDITLKDVNMIIRDYDGLIEIQIDDDLYSQGIVSPITFNNKVILRVLTEELYEESVEDTTPEPDDDELIL